MRRSAARAARATALTWLGAAALVGCSLDTAGTLPGTGETTSTSASSGTTSSSSTSGTTATSSTTSGTGGAGGMGGSGAGGTGGGVGGSGGTGGSTPCNPGETMPCYDGPAGTEGKGICVGGTATCDASGSGFGACVGQVLPGAEDCATPEDEDCDGVVNGAAAGCLCSPGATQSCYSGPAGTQGVGVCVAGTQTCAASGLAWGPCSGEVVPTPETCNTPGDDDCDGQTNEAGVGCNCVAGTMQACYSGPAGTQNNGPCQGGTQTCNAQGTGYGPCMGEVLPGTEDCDVGLVDEDCDGSSNESGASCLCVPGAATPCYGGPAGTQGVGICMPGSAACSANGLALGACVGAVLPATETCDLGLLDEDCDGSANESGAGCVCTPNAVTACYNGPAGTLGVGLCAAGTSTCNATGTAAGACIGAVGPAGEDCTVAVDENCDGVNPTCSGTAGWSKLFGDPANQQGNAVAFDASGNIVFTGQFSAQVNFGGGTLDAVNAGKIDQFVAKFSATGVHQWSKEFGENGKDELGLGVAADGSGNVLTTGYYNGSSFNPGGGALPGGAEQVFVLKLDSAGNHVWSKGFGDGDDQRGLALAVDSAGDVFVTGFFEKNLDFGGGCSLTNTGNNNTNIDAFVVKLASGTGNCLWAKRAGDGANQIGFGLAVDPAGDVYVTGSFSGALNFGTNLTSAGMTDMFVVKLSGATGTELWAKGFGDASTQAGRAVSVNGTRVVVTGTVSGALDPGGGLLTTAGGGDVLVASYALDGTPQWQALFGDAAAQTAGGVALDPAGHPVLTGYFAGDMDFGGGAMTSAGGEDIYLAKLSSAGAHLWSKRFGGATNQRGLAVATDAVGNAALTGLVTGTADLGNGTLTSAGADDVLLAGFSP